MNENTNIDINENETTKTSTATVTTPLVGISVKTETVSSRENVNNIQSGDTANATPNKNGLAPIVTINLQKRKYWQWLGNEILSFSSFLFLNAIASILITVFATSVDATVKILLVIYSFASLLLSVVVKLKTDDSKWIKLPFFKSLINDFDSKELNKETFEKLIRILEM